MLGKNLENLKKSCYKACSYPPCKNTTIRTPDKEFVCVPESAQKRKLWYEAAGIPDKKKKGAYFCEDHFDLKNDLVNYYEWSMIGSRKRLKDGVIPRFSSNTPEVLDIDMNMNQDGNFENN